VRWVLILVQAVQIYHFGNGLLSCPVHHGYEGNRKIGKIDTYLQATSTRSETHNSTETYLVYEAVSKQSPKNRDEFASIVNLRFKKSYIKATLFGTERAARSDAVQSRNHLATGGERNPLGSLSPCPDGISSLVLYDGGKGR
jgi:hypothetical protein